MKSISTYIFEKLKIDAPDKRYFETDDSTLDITDLLNIFSEVLNISYDKADQNFINALKKFCENNIDINNIEIHTSARDFKTSTPMYKVKKENSEIKLIKSGVSMYNKLTEKFYNSNSKHVGVNFNIDSNPLDEYLTIDYKLNMFDYGSIEGGFLFIA